MRAFSSCWISTRFLNLFGTCLDVTLDHSDDFSITGRTRSRATSTSHEISVRRDRTDESTDELRQGVWNKCSCNAGGSSHYRFDFLFQLTAVGTSNFIRVLQMNLIQRAMKWMPLKPQCLRNTELTVSAATRCLTGLSEDFKRFKAAQFLTSLLLWWRAGWSTSVRLAGLSPAAVVWVLHHSLRKGTR